VSAAEEQPRRLTPTERLHEVTLTALQRHPAEPEHTVGLTLNAKGDVQIEVTGRGTDLDKLATAVLDKFAFLLERFPRNLPPVKT
jgi:hypothetical protein